MAAEREQPVEITGDTILGGLGEEDDEDMGEDELTIQHSSMAVSQPVQQIVVSSPIPPKPTRPL
ncbi:WSSV382 [White spot syndrome virus]|uniref:WSSV382 n=1 Tax=White spot syndrome virus TaxID=342409 RepID=A0A2I6SC74_9VIRU|nr:WSSV382 [White spot syndrome virus]